MDTSSLEAELDELREGYSPEWGPVQEILEEGEHVGNGNWSAVFYNPDVKDNVVAKVFSGERIEDIRNRIERAHNDYFPASLPIVCDTTEVDNPDLLVKEHNAAVVVQHQSDESILDTTGYDTAVEEATDFVDQLVMRGQIMDDFKAEAIHRYGEDLKYIDFEDKAAVKSWPLHGEPSTNGDVTYEMALMYANLSAGLADEYNQSIDDVKDRIAEQSNVIEDEVYREDGFVPRMIGEWHHS